LGRRGVWWERAIEWNVRREMEETGILSAAHDLEPITN
jgi:hypothetical protein